MFDGMVSKKGEVIEKCNRCKEFEKCEGNDFCVNCLISEGETKHRKQAETIRCLFCGKDLEGHQFAHPSCIDTETLFGYGEEKLLTKIQNC